MAAQLTGYVEPVDRPSERRQCGGQHGRCPVRRPGQSDTNQPGIEILDADREIELEDIQRNLAVRRKTAALAVERRALDHEHAGLAGAAQRERSRIA